MHYDKKPFFYQKTLSFFSQQMLNIFLSENSVVFSQDTTPRTPQRRLKHNPSACEKGPFNSPEAPTCGIGLRFATDLRAAEVPSGKAGRETALLHLPSASPQLTGASQQGASTLLWRPHSCSCRPWDTSRPDLPVWRSAGTETAAPAYFKSCYLQIWLPISLNLGAQCNHPLRNRQVLAHSGTHQEKKSGFLDNHKGVRDNQELGQSWMIRFISYTKPFLQAWERGLFHLLHRGQHRESSKMGNRGIVSKWKSLNLRKMP